MQSWQRWRSDRRPGDGSGSGAGAASARSLVRNRSGRRTTGAATGGRRRCAGCRRARCTSTAGSASRPPPPGGSRTRGIGRAACGAGRRGPSVVVVVVVVRPASSLRLEPSEPVAQCQLQFVDLADEIAGVPAHLASDDDPEVTAIERARVAATVGLLGPPLRGLSVAVHEHPQRHRVRPVGPLREGRARAAGGRTRPAARRCSVS